jgi:hypothetical protein
MKPNIDKTGGLPQTKSVRSQQQFNKAGQGQGQCPISKKRKK